MVRPTDWQFVHFGRYAMGGAGIVFGEETAVEARGRKTYHCAGIWNDHQVKAYRRITDFIKEMGARTGDPDRPLRPQRRFARRDGGLASAR